MSLFQKARIFFFKAPEYIILLYKKDIRFQNFSHIQN